MRYLLLFLLCVFSAGVQAQSCSVFFSSQEDVDNFPSDYPNCTVLSNLYIDYGVTNLDSLYNIRKIDSELNIYAFDQLDISGLSNLDTVIGGVALTRAVGDLPSLRFVGEILRLGENFIDLPLLSHVGGNLSIEGLPGLSSTSIFPELKTIGGSLSVYSNQSSNTSLNEFIGFSKLHTVNSISIYFFESVDIGGFDMIDSLGSLTITTSGELLPNAFGSLTHVEGRTYVDRIDNAVFPLTSLQSTGDLTIRYSKITGLSGINPLLSINSELWIHNNSLLQDLAGLTADHVADLDKFVLRGNQDLMTCDYDHICDLLSSTIDLQISDNHDGCKTITQLENRCSETEVAPQNDLCTNLITLSLGDQADCDANSTVYTTNGARMHQEPYCVSDFGEEVFFSFTPSESKAYSISVSDYTSAMGMELYQGACSDLTLVQCGYDGISRYLKADSTYVISIFCDIPTEYSDFKLCVTETSLEGDVDGFGVNVQAPLQDLHIDGAILIGNTVLDYAGTMRFNGTRFEGYNGFEWVRLDNGATTIGLQDGGIIDNAASSRQSAAVDIEGKVAELEKENQDLKIRLEKLERMMKEMERE